MTNSTIEIAPRKRNIAILDQDPSVSKLAVNSLPAEIYCVRSYSNALEFFEGGAIRDTSCLLVDDMIQGNNSALRIREELLKMGSEIPVIVTSASWNVPMIVRSIKGGADGFVRKPFDKQELLDAVSETCCRQDAATDEDRFRKTLMSRAATLSERETEIVRLVTVGKLNKEIAADLGLALVTVKVHRSNAMRKLGAGNPAELALIANMIGISSWNGPRAM